MSAPPSLGYKTDPELGFRGLKSILGKNETRTIIEGLLLIHALREEYNNQREIEEILPLQRLSLVFSLRDRKAPETDSIHAKALKKTVNASPKALRDIFNAG